MLSFLKSFGSGINANYSISSHPAFTVGEWNVFDAKSRSTKEPVSVFVLDKRELADKLQRNGFKHKSAIVSQVVEHASKDVQQLTRLRHPSMLRIVAPLESSSRSLTFVAERVTASLTLLLRTKEEMDDLSIVRGGTLVVEALRFLHDELGLVHLNLTPEAILIDANGDWKLRGLSFVQPFKDFSPGQFNLPQEDPRLPRYMHAPVDFLAPEIVMEQTLAPESDVWSFSCILYTVYYGVPPLDTRGNPSNYKEEYQRFKRKLDKNQLHKLPKALQPYIQAMFAAEPSGRISLTTLLATDFFDSPLVKALRRMDEFATMDVNDRVSYLKHLNSTLLPQFPKNVRVRKIISFALGELDGARQDDTGSLLADLMFACATDMSRLTFSEKILPMFAKLSSWYPFQMSVAQNLQIIVADTSDKDFTSKVLPTLVETLKANDNSHADAQCAILSKSDIFLGQVNVSKLEQSLFPAVINLFAATPSKSVKIASVQSCQAMITKGLSKTLIVDQLIPTLEAMKTRDPAVVVAVAALWDAITSKLTAEGIITHVIPQILQLSMATGLTVPQYKAILGHVRKQLTQVEKEQVEQLKHNTNQETEGEDDWLNSPSLPSTAPAVAPSGPMDTFDSSPSTSFGTASSAKPAPPQQYGTPFTSSLKVTSPNPSQPTSNSSFKMTPSPASQTNTFSSTQTKMSQSRATASQTSQTRPSQASFATPASSKPIQPALLPTSMQALQPTVLQPVQANSFGATMSPLQPLRAPAPDAGNDFGSFASAPQGDSLI